MVRITRNNTNAKRPLSAPGRYIESKVKSIYRKLVKKEWKKTDNEVYNEKKRKAEKKVNRWVKRDC